MANDVGALCTLIISDLQRSDTSLSDLLVPYIQSSVLDYEGYRFHFNEQNLTLTISNTNSYVLSLFANVGNGLADIIEVDRFGITVGSTRSYELDETSWEMIKQIDSGPGTLQGYPQMYAFFNQTIRVWPLPNTTMTGEISAHVKFNPLVTMADSNPWTNDGRNLIRYATAMRYAGGRLKDMAAAQVFAAGVQSALSQLQRRTDALSGHVLKSSGL